ncbi:MAG TPA: bifunctional adenosylcobinamide kinase/adenosylcobinamide-phosphate guanylyltransferase, partial [Anaerovoracaceae bacterium]|nr:bifunctional adenosylcobinamide kinase/adenosylcobinamide-phosphate guanylyltransferase [Anaerovoracaceae bacterium]
LYSWKKIMFNDKINTERIGQSTNRAYVSDGRETWPDADALQGGTVNILISGGCKNGKSYYAQQLAKRQAGDAVPLYYVATMEPADGEDQARILRHRQEREGWGFTTLERGSGIGALDADFSGSFLLDSVTALLSNEMFRRDGTVDRTAYLRVAEELAQLADKSCDIVFVSDYIFSDAMKYEELTELYRKGLAWIDRTLAKKCDAVIEVTYGNVLMIKGDIRKIEGEIRMAGSRNLQIEDLPFCRSFSCIGKTDSRERSESEALKGTL